MLTLDSLLWTMYSTASRGCMWAHPLNGHTEHALFYFNQSVVSFQWNRHEVTPRSHDIVQLNSEGALWMGGGIFMFDKGYVFELPT